MNSLEIFSCGSVFEDFVAQKQDLLLGSALSAAGT